MDRKPGRPRLLSLDLIVDAALADGIATFSMPSVATRLGVAHSGLYRYVHDRDELLVSAIERAALSVDWPDAELPWRDLLRAIADTVWSICDRYPGYDAVVLSPPYWPTRLVDQVTPYIASLHKQGFGIEDSSVAVAVAGNLALTSSLGGMTARSDQPADPRASARARHDRILDIVLDGLANRVVS